MTAATTYFFIQEGKGERVPFFADILIGKESNLEKAFVRVESDERGGGCLSELLSAALKPKVGR